jgi:hypothetical protein
MKQLLCFLGVFSLTGLVSPYSPLFAQPLEFEDRLPECASVVKDIMEAADGGIPKGKS